MISAPKRFYEVKTEDGISFKFRLTIRTLRKLQESTGKNYQELMLEMGEDGSDPLQIICDFIWAASLPFNPAFTKEDAVDVYETLIDDGYDTFDMNGLLLNILQVSGLYPKDTVVSESIDAIREESNLAQEKALNEDITPSKQD